MRMWEESAKEEGARARATRSKPKDIRPIRRFMETSMRGVLQVRRYSKS
jgi:hypothetical protein